MAKTFIPKTIKLTEEEIKKIRKKFPFLTDVNIAEVKHWNSKRSPYDGTIIDKDAQYKAYPYDRNQDQFLEEHPDGEIWK